MKDSLMKAYLWTVIIVSSLNLIFSILDSSVQTFSTRIILTIVSFFDFPSLILAVILIPYILKRKLNKIYLVSPIVYLSAYLLFIFVGIILSFTGVNLFTLDSLPSIIFNVLIWLYYLFNILFANYLFSVKEKKSKKK